MGQVISSVEIEHADREDMGQVISSVELEHADSL